jgi:hypothetical protein
VAALLEILRAEAVAAIARNFIVKKIIINGSKMKLYECNN